MGTTRSRGICVRVIGAAAMLAAMSGCGHGPIEHQLDQLPYYFDNELPFQPDRIWRLKVSWKPYLLDAAKAMVFKQVQLVVHSDRDRKRLEAEITSRGGDDRYLLWLEARLFPLGNWEIRDDARITRHSDGVIISLRTHSLKEVPIDDELDVRPVWFPDPVTRAVGEGCHELDWDVIPKDTSVGFEVELQSRHDTPNAERWTLREHDLPTFWWRQWSVGQEHSISYRTVLWFKANVSRCPLPPLVYEQFNKIRLAQRTGIQW
jgi:hypothetical protein